MREREELIMNNINMKLVKVNGKTREDLLVALVSLGEIDADFNGDNGIEYLWDNVDSTKYESNMKYLLDTLKDKETDKELIEEYVSSWIGRDSYYKEHILEVVYDESGNLSLSQKFDIDYTDIILKDDIIIIYNDIRLFFLLA